MTLSTGYAVEPEQSTVAIIAHHPQAVYFGMKSGFVPDEPKPDELIAGTDRGGELVPSDEELTDDGTVDAEVDRPSAQPVRGS
jgi:5-methyltetrahydrofolate--homocysteine methyltransferase